MVLGLPVYRTQFSGLSNSATLSATGVVTNLPAALGGAGGRHGFGPQSYKPREAASVTLLPERSRTAILPFSKVTFSILVNPSGTVV